MRKALCALALGCAVAVPAMAADEKTDEVLETLDNIKTYYQDNDIAGMKEEVDFLGQLTGKLRVKGLEAFLLEPKDGWTAEDAEGIAAGGGFLGGATTVSRVYKKDGKTLKMEIIGDNPAMASVLGMMLSNQAYVAQSGAEIVRIGREKAVLQNDELQMKAGDWFLKFSGTADKDTKIEWAESADIKGLEDY